MLVMKKMKCYEYGPRGGENIIVLSLTFSVIIFAVATDIIGQHILDKTSVLSCHRCLIKTSVEKMSSNRTEHIRHQCRETAVLSWHRCLIKTGVEKNEH